MARKGKSAPPKARWKRPVAGILLAGFSLLVILGHQRCGAVTAALEALSGKAQQPKYIQALLKHVEPDVKEVQPAIEASLRQQKIQAELGDMRKKGNVWIDEDYFKLPNAAPRQQGAAPTASPAVTPSQRPNQ